VTGARRVAVYVSGSIAAYKACGVVTALRKQGAEVRVAMTASATRFVTPMTFQSLSGHPVATSLWDEAAGAAAEGAGHAMAHIGLSGWAQAQVAVAATADLISRLALGLADDAVTATALACRAPLLIAPAMETAMWEHPATRDHVTTLQSRGAVFVGPVSGRLASGHHGAGRMAEPHEVVDAVLTALGGSPDAASEGSWLRGRRVVITSGGTREPIDPVRFIGNHSSGKMGLALAREAARLGAEVTLVTTAGRPNGDASRLDVVEVGTADEMLAAVRTALPGAAALIMAAAVADYRPADVAPRKLKKTAPTMTVELVRTVDVLAALRDDPVRRGVVVVGFAAETDDLLANAQHKLEAKGLDLIVANDVGVPGIGMGSDRNAVTILGRDGVRIDAPAAPKTEIARRVLEALRPLVRA
jgi:phosphopantothenoylcysteine decarboxylase/phosphopantothenate--cysteine ligase